MDQVPGDSRGVRRQADVCAHAAIFLAILGILVGSSLDLSCAPAFIWNLTFTILGAALSFTPAIFICALLSPFKGAETVYQTLREGSVTGSAFFLHPGIYPLLALLLLPFLFLVLRGIILTPGLKPPADFQADRTVKEEEVPYGRGKGDPAAAAGKPPERGNGKRPARSVRKAKFRPGRQGKT